MVTISDLFDLEHTAAKDYLKSFVYPWEAVGGIRKMIIRLGGQLGNDYREVRPQVWVHETAVVAPTAYLGAPCVIGPNTEVRHCAFIRESALVGAGCVVGNSVELKNVILFDAVEVPHFNYVGDSILGYKSHMGAGSITSNVKGNHTTVAVHCGDEVAATGMEKLGAMLGDYAEIGCNAVLNPGTIVGRNTQVYPLTSVRGSVPSNSILKQNGIMVSKR